MARISADDSFLAGANPVLPAPNSSTRHDPFFFSRTSIADLIGDQISGFEFARPANPGRQNPTLFDEQGLLAVEIIKGSVDPQSAKATHQVDGLAGATLTSQGVNNLLHFWLGESGFGPFLAKLHKGEA